MLPRPHCTLPERLVIIAKHGKLRICLDPRDLKKALKRPKYQMLTLQEILPQLAKAKVFSTSDDQGKPP